MNVLTALEALCQAGRAAGELADVVLTTSPPLLEHATANLEADVAKLIMPSSCRIRALRFCFCRFVFVCGSMQKPLGQHTHTCLVLQV